MALRTDNGVVLPEAVSAEIWAGVQEQSAIMAASRMVALPGSGVTIPIISTDASADWVDEGDEKPVSESTLSNKSMTPYKLAVIQTFSNEFRRDLPAVYGELARRLPNALAVKFDETVINGSAPGSNFDTLEGCTELEINSDPYAQAVAVFQEVATNNGDLSAWIASPSLQGTLLGAVDGFGRPLFTANPVTDSTVGQLLGRPVYGTRRSLTDCIGLAGDFAGSALYGTVEGVQIAVSDQATVTDGSGNPINLWQRNLFALRCEIEVGFVVKDASRFVRIVSSADAPAGGGGGGGDA